MSEQEIKQCARCHCKCLLKEFGKNRLEQPFLTCERCRTSRINRIYQCTKCKVSRTDEEFGYNKFNQLYKTCISCRVCGNEWNNKNKDKIHQINIKKYYNNREKNIQKSITYRQLHKQQLKKKWVTYYNQLKKENKCVICKQHNNTIYTTCELCRTKKSKKHLTFHIHDYSKKKYLECQYTFNHICKKFSCRYAIMSKEEAFCKLQIKINNEINEIYKQLVQQF